MLLGASTLCVTLLEHLRLMFACVSLGRSACLSQYSKMWLMHRVCLTVLHPQANLGDYLTHQQAHHVLLQLLAPDNTRYFSPAMMELLHPPQLTIRAATAAAGGDASDEVGCTPISQLKQHDVALHTTCRLLLSWWQC